MRRTRALALVSAAAVVVAVPIATGRAATPSSQTISVPTTAGSTVTKTWSGVIPPLANATSDCASIPAAAKDVETINLAVPAGAYSKVTATITFSITWTPVGTSTTNDEILTVTGPPATGSEVGSSDTSSTTETVTGSDLPAGAYQAQACGFANTTAQPYTGKVVITTQSRSAQTSLPSAPANGLAFSPSVAADPQRDEAEPLIETAPDGHTYTCGPTGFSSAADYAQVSTDGGNQFHLIGTPPRGQQGAGGGGDCAINLAPEKNTLGNYQYAYAGLDALNGFTTTTSADNAHTLTNAGPQGNGITNTGVLTDRQWNVFTDSKTVLLSYNQQAPRNIVVQKSVDGGLTYGPLTAIGGANPDFPGPMRTLPGTFRASDGGRIVFFAWNQGTNVNLSVSYDQGAHFVNCVAAVDPGGPSAGFPTADSDSAGNIYIAYANKSAFHTYLVTLPHASLSKCNQPVTTGNTNLPTDTVSPKNNPQAVGFSTPLQVDRDAIRTTVFPWVAAGGAPGRVAVTFYGTQTEGDPNQGSFKGSWNVYVNESVNALSTGRTFSQVQATTHPMHYDSICLLGLGCSVSGGDRSLADFFAIKYNAASHRLQVVYNNDAKKPGETAGHVASPMVVTQIGGPSLSGATVSGGNAPVVRTASTDPTGDALANYSNLVTPGVPINEPASDLTSVSISPYTAKGGFTVTMKLASLSAVNLAKALADTNSKSLLYVLRFSDGYQPAAAVARYQPADPVAGTAATWTFKFNNYQTLATQCLALPSTSDDKCLAFGVAGKPGNGVLGTVNATTGTITMQVPRNNVNDGTTQLFALQGGQGDSQRPAQVAAASGTRFYDASAFTFGDSLAKVGDIQEVQSYLYPLDNTPAMDFLLP